MRGLLACTVLVLAIGVIYGQKDCVCNYSGGPGKASAELRGRLDSQAARLSRVSAKVQELASKLETGRAKATEVVSGQRSIKSRLRKMEGKQCPDGEFFCGILRVCVGGLLVCDGRNDCPSKYDEDAALCKSPVEAGTTFEGNLYGNDLCTRRRPYKYQFTITSVRKVDYFTAHLGVKGTLVLFSNTDGIEGKASLPVEGHYCFAESKLVFYPPEDDRLGFTCWFDPTDPNTCDGAIVHEQSGSKCVEFELKRVR